MTLRILLTGANGQVGAALVPLLSGLGSVRALERKALDLTDSPALVAQLQSFHPQIIVNAAAYTAVDRAETEPEMAYAVNATAPQILAQYCRAQAAVLVHYSTDYVFDGSKTTPYLESDSPVPLGVYGASKLEGESAVLATECAAWIFRTSWVYGSHGNNFLKTMIRLGQERAEVRVVNDQWGAPTWARAIAQATYTALLRGLSEARSAKALLSFAAESRGIYHLTNSGVTTWYEFARAIFSQRSECKARLIPIPTQDYPTPARRPANSRLDGQRLAQTFALQLAPWEQDLALCLAELPAPC